MRAPDSIQFNLRGFSSDDEAKAFQDAANARGVAVQIFGLSKDNARAFWNWQFISPQGDLPRTRNMLMRACKRPISTSSQRRWFRPPKT